MGEANSVNADRGKWYRAFVVYGVFGVGMLAIMFISRGAIRLAGFTKENPPPQTMARLLPILLLGSVWGIAVALAANRIWPATERLRQRLARSHAGIIGYIVMVVGGLSVAWGGALLLGAMGLRSPQVIQKIVDFQEGITWPWLLAAIGVVGIMPGIGEELLFRGYLQASIKARWGKWAGILIASALFGIAHINPVHALWACGLGIYFGFLAERVGSIRPGMVCHATVNSIATLLMAVTGPHMAVASENADRALSPQMRIGLLIGVAFFGTIAGLCIGYVVWKFPRQSPDGRTEPEMRMAAPVFNAANAE